MRLIFHWFIIIITAVGCFFSNEVRPLLHLRDLMHSCGCHFELLRIRDDDDDDDDGGKEISTNYKYSNEYAWAICKSE